MAGKGGWAPKWSKAQKDALIAAMLDHGRSIHQATELAHAGELPIGATADERLPPFPIPRNTVGDLRAQAGRQRRAIERATKDPDTVMAETIGELQAMLAREMERTRNAIARRAADAPERIARMARTAAAVDSATAAFAKRQRAGAPSMPAPNPGDAVPGQTDLLDVLAEEMRGNGART